MLIFTLLSIHPAFADAPESAPVATDEYRGRRPPPRPPPPRRPPPPPPRYGPPPAADHDVSLTLTVSDLRFVMITGNLEVELVPRFSLGGTVGVGSDGQEGLYRLGGEARGYLLGDFDGGLFLGAGVGVTNAGWFELDGGAAAVSGFGGAKLTLPVGFTLEGKLGAEALGTRTAAYVQPVAAINLGWSF